MLKAVLIAQLLVLSACSAIESDHGKVKVVPPLTATEHQTYEDLGIVSFEQEYSERDSYIKTAQQAKDRAIVHLKSEAIRRSGEFIVLEKEEKTKCYASIFSKNTDPCVKLTARVYRKKTL